MGAARTAPGLVGDVRADRWWPALLLAELDTAVAPSHLLKLPLDAYDRSRGYLRAEGLLYGLHPVTIEALECLVFAVESPPLLFRWHRDFSLLFPALKTILFQAGLAPVTGNLFERLRVTCWRSSDLLDQIDPRAWTPTSTSRVRLRAPKARDARVEPGRKRGGIPAHKRHPEIVLIGSESPRSLRNFLKNVYAPRRLMDCGPCGEEGHARSINCFANFLACEPTLDQLTDDLLEEFAIWRKKGGRTNSTINTTIGPLLALWRFAYRKRQLDHLPRDFEKLRVPKRLPEAWTPEEVGLILKAAAETEGFIGGIPAGDFLCGLLLTLYDTGLRVGALLAVSEDGLNEDGWLTVPADFQKHHADQAFRLHSETLGALAKFPRGRARLFQTHWKRPGSELSRLFREIRKRSGVPKGQKDGFHKLRRTNATQIANAVDDEAARRQLGHSSVQLTRSAYIDPRQIHRRSEPASLIQRPTWAPDRTTPLQHGEPEHDRENCRL